MNSLGLHGRICAKNRRGCYGYTKQGHLPVGGTALEQYHITEENAWRLPKPSRIVPYPTFPKNENEIVLLTLYI